MPLGDYNIGSPVDSIRTGPYVILMLESPLEKVILISKDI